MKLINLNSKAQKIIERIVTCFSVKNTKGNTKAYPTYFHTLDADLSVLAFGLLKKV